MSTVSSHDEGILKQVLAGVPPGFYVDMPWLAEHGVSRQLAHKYAESGWLERVVTGLYRRPTPHSARPSAHDWMLPLLSAQRIMGYEIHVGGTTSLALAGHVHYLPLGKQPAYLYSDKPPTWLKRLTLQSELRFRKKSLFTDPDLGLENTEAGLGIRNEAASLPWEWPLLASSPERAVLEAINELPRNESFQLLDELFGSLVNLRPQMTTELLTNCTSVQVKRLFLVFADRHEHAWRKYLDTSAVDLGSGDRAFFPGGKLHPEYRITVPGDLLPRSKGEGPGHAG